MPTKHLPSVDAQLLESEERYRTLIENASDLIQSVRPDGSFEYVNQAWLDKLGYTEEDLESLNIWDIIHPDSVSECTVHFQQTMEGIRLPELRATFIDKQGNKIPVEGSAQARYLDGEIVATHSFFRDISERLRAAELEAENKRLEQEQQARYLEKMAALGKLSAGLSHELNNPAAAAQRSAKLLRESVGKRDDAVKLLAKHGIDIEGWTVLESLVSRCVERKEEPVRLSHIEASRREDELQDWLEDHNVQEAWNYAQAFAQGGVTVQLLDGMVAAIPGGAIPASVSWVGETIAIDEHAAVVSRSTARISELVGAVKAYSFRDRAIEQDVDIHDGLENTLVILAYRLRDAQVVTEFDDSIPPVRTYGSGLNQVWTNILDNAVDAIADERDRREKSGEDPSAYRGVIQIKTVQDGEYAVVEIRDNGSGIEPERLTRIFEPFYTTKSQGQGTGLGLDIVWRIVTEEHGGSIETTSEPGCTAFRITIPICPDARGSALETSTD
jgi:PAS domain S-box-containing protein